MAKSRGTASSNPASVAEAALRLLKKHEWPEITLAWVARLAKLPLSVVISEVASKSALPGAILRTLAAETTSRHIADAASTDPRERLFDVTMVFFDVQQLHATALKKLYRALQYDPPTLLATRNDIVRVAGELLALAEADTGLSPWLQATVFSGVLIRAVSTWRGDGADMGKTMAQLDGDLRRVERLLWPEQRNADIDRSPKAKATRGDRRSKKGKPR